MLASHVGHCCVELVIFRAKDNMCTVCNVTQLKVDLRMLFTVCVQWIYCSVPLPDYSYTPRRCLGSDVKRCIFLKNNLYVCKVSSSLGFDPFRHRGFVAQKLSFITL